jgi:hypothetical protein
VKSGHKDARAKEARKLRLLVAPHLEVYNELENVFWPFLLSVSRPDFASSIVTTDHRGHRVTRLGAETVRSDAAVDGVAFLLGGSFSFGVGASDDSHTLAGALWRRTGVPYVNLGIRQATSSEELISVIPFAERRTTFVVCSGLNNLACGALDHFVARTGGVDPLFGSTYDDARLRILADFSIPKLARLASDPVARLNDRALRRELRDRRRSRIRRRFGPVRRLKKRVRGRFAPPAPPPPAVPGAPDEGLNEIVAEAAARQLRDLRLLRRLVPDEARVVFGLQPIALSTNKEWSPEEVALFEALDLLQPQRWQVLKRLLETRWSSYAAILEQGCMEIGVPFVDLSRGEYSGWCFVDRVHMTDRGYETAAAVLEEVLADGAS